MQHCLHESPKISKISNPEFQRGAAEMLVVDLQEGTTNKEPQQTNPRYGFPGCQNCMFFSRAKGKPNNNNNNNNNRFISDFLFWTPLIVFVASFLVQDWVEVIGEL